MLFLRGLFLLTLFSSCTGNMSDFDLDLKEKGGEEFKFRHNSALQHHNDNINSTEASK